MMRVNREELLKVLESVSPGLAQREVIEQSTCLAFKGGKVATFNDEIACSRKSPVALEGAVKAEPLLNLLSKLAEDEIGVEQKEGEVIIHGKRRKAGIRMESDVTLPVDAVEVPETWMPLPEEFNDAVSITHACASTDNSDFTLTCVHIHPEYLEACDRFQIARYPLKLGTSNPMMLVRAESLKMILGLDMTEISETDSWLHFRNPAGLVFSCRRYIDDYANLDGFISSEGLSPMTLPGGLEEVLEKAEIFSSENALGNHVSVQLKPDAIIIEGKGSYGWFKEMKTTKFDGDPVRFLISPKLLREASSKSNVCGVDSGRLFIDSGKFKYSVCTEQPENGQA